MPFHEVFGIQTFTCPYLLRLLCPIYHFMILKGAHECCCTPSNNMNLQLHSDRKAYTALYHQNLTHQDGTQLLTGF